MNGTKGKSSLLPPISTLIILIPTRAKQESPRRNAELLLGLSLSHLPLCLFCPLRLPSIDNKLYRYTYVTLKNDFYRCDRILWRGNCIEQLSYIRGESRLSDHRPVCAVFSVGIEMANKCIKFRKGFSCTGATLEYHNMMPQRHNTFNEL